MPETINHRWAEINNALSARQVFSNLADQSNTFCSFIQGFNTFNLYGKSRRIVIAKVFADTSKLMNNRNTKFMK